MTPRTTALGVAAVWAALLAAAPPPRSSVRLLASAGSSPDHAAPLLAAVSLAAWAGAGYLLLVTALALGSRLPGALGRLLSRALRLAAPPALLRAVALTLGAGLAVAPVAATPALALDRPTASLAPPLSAEPVPDLDWPVSARPGPTTTPSPTAPPPSATPQPGTTSAARTVTVRAGDTLWCLAARELGPRATHRAVAVAWPRWWQANREAVGDDPDLLLPGTVLVPPAP